MHINFRLPLLSFSFSFSFRVQRNAMLSMMTIIFIQTLNHFHEILWWKSHHFLSFPNEVFTKWSESIAMMLFYRTGIFCVTFMTENLLTTEQKKTFLILVKPKLSQLKDDIDKSVHVQFKFDWSISVQKQLCKSLIDSLQLPNFIDRKRVRERESGKKDTINDVPIKTAHFH